MTDKQIIVNGVDVSGCKLYRDEVSFVGGETITDACSIWIWQRDYSGLEPSCVMKCNCSDNPNCYYKQLKRAESQIVDLNKMVEAKEQECEELKAEIKLSKEMLIQNTSETNKYTIPQIIEQFISDNYIDQQNEDGYTIPVFIQIENILDIKEDLKQQLDQLKQILAKIKGICNNNDELQGDFNLVDCDKYKLGKHNLANKILQKISECEVENAR